ncbi:MAG: zinc ABC transporter substrate-binding protein [Crocinitomicaceae bacterium]|nr:zinc ABC transporter substrate-binding protein [Crocinitomicaceae bacterium]
MLFIKNGNFHKTMRRRSKIRFKSITCTLFLSATLFLISSCDPSARKSSKLNVITTTNIFTDIVHNIGGDSIQLQGLMGAGVDPHLYKASEGDVSKLSQSDLIFYAGLHLEGKMVDIFEKMKSVNKTTVSLGEAIDKNLLIESKNFGGNYDPHTWFNVKLVKQMADQVAKSLTKADPKSAAYYKSNNIRYQKELDELEIYIRTKIESLPKEKRILVTAHDAFSYFGKEYGVQVLGLQGISTATEAGVKDVQRLRDFIIETKLNAIFIESSVPRRNIEALQNAVEKDGHVVQIGGSLYSDALGSPNTDEGTYIGMFKYNVNTMVESLK